MAIEPEPPLEDDLPDSALFWRWVGKATRPVIGWVLLGLAALFILVGWYGVSGTSVVAKQIPYVVSGGIAGVFLAVFGAYFLGTEELRKDSGRLDRLEQMVLELHEALLTRDDAPSPTARVESASASNGHEYVSLSKSRTYHRLECAMVASKPNTTVLTPSTIRQRKLTPCQLCEPSLPDAP